MTKERKDWICFAGFAGVALLLSACLTGLSSLDRTAEIPYLWSLLVKMGLLLLVGLIISLTGTRGKLVGKQYLTQDIFWILIPLFLTVCVSFGFFNTHPGILTGVMLLLNTIATVLWEELYYRFFSRLLFERNGAYHVRWVILTALVFGASRLPAAFVSTFGTVLLQSVLAASEGVFLLALYAKSGSILLPMISHFLTSSVTVFFHAFSTNAEGIFGLGGVFLALLTVMYSAIGFWLLFSSHRIAERKRKIKATEERSPVPQVAPTPAPEELPSDPESAEMASADRL